MVGRVMVLKDNNSSRTWEFNEEHDAGRTSGTPGQESCTQHLCTCTCISLSTKVATLRISLTSPSLHPPNWFSCMLFLHNTSDQWYLYIYIPMILYMQWYFYASDTLYQWYLSNLSSNISIPVMHLLYLLPMIPLLPLYHALYTSDIPIYYSDII